MACNFDASTGTIKTTSSQSNKRQPNYSCHVAMADVNSTTEGPRLTKLHLNSDASLLASSPGMLKLFSVDEMKRVRVPADQVIALINDVNVELTQDEAQEILAKQHIFAKIMKLWRQADRLKALGVYHFGRGWVNSILKKGFRRVSPVKKETAAAGDQSPVHDVFVVDEGKFSSTKIPKRWSQRHQRCTKRTLLKPIDLSSSPSRGR